MKTKKDEIKKFWTTAVVNDKRCPVEVSNPLL